MKVVGVCGYGYSGSGALFDLLKEYDECVIGSEVEFELLYSPGGLLDLEYHLMKNCNRFNSGDIAIRQFKRIIKINSKKSGPFYQFTNGKFFEISNKYVDSLCQCKWRGLVSYDMYLDSAFEKRLRYSFLRRLIKVIHILGFRTADYKRIMYLSVAPKNFYVQTRKYIEDLFKASGYIENKICVVNQLFPANNIKPCFKFFLNSKAIVVDRDPRDLYISIKLFIKDAASFIPMDDVNSFIRYYRAVRLTKDNDCKEILYIKFEDLIYKYQDTINEIEKFLGISRHMYPKKYFEPNKSVANTQLFRRYLKYEKDIKIIEHELKEFLYIYPDNNIINENIVPFTW